MLTQLATYLAPAGIDWAICGGTAIDLFAGHPSRQHKDLDVAVFWDQRDALLRHLLASGWRVFEPEGGLLREITCPADDFQQNHNLWCVAGTSSPYRIEHVRDAFFNIETTRAHQDALDFIEFLFSHRREGQLLYRRDPRIRHPRPFLRNSSGIPYLVPELALLYKSVFVRDLGSTQPADVETIAHCRHDFALALPHLDSAQRQWLAAALRLTHPGGHEWLAAL